ncbi:hypothetical protein ACF0H5_022889 [Mactra antiquata]
MNEDLSQIIEQALQYASPLPVNPIEEAPSMQENDVIEDFLAEDENSKECVEAMPDCMSFNDETEVGSQSFTSLQPTFAPNELISGDDSSFSSFGSPMQPGIPITDSNNSKGKRPASNEASGVKPKIKRKRRREKNPEPPPDPILPPCSVCDEKSSGYHYGANTCEACKGFFRRTLKKQEVDYKCKCKTDDERENWKRGPYKNGCPACRYERCLTVGMSKNAIKIGRYTLNHKTSNIKQVKTLEAIDDFIESTVRGSDNTSPSSTPSLEATINTLAGQSRPPTAEICDCDMTSPGSSTSFMSDSSSTTSDTTSLCPQTIYSRPLESIKYSSLTLKEIDSIVKTLTESSRNCAIYFDAFKDDIGKMQSEYSEKFNLRREIFGDMGILSQEEFCEFYKVTGLDLDGRLKHVTEALNFLEKKITAIVTFAKSIPGFKDLCLDDQAKLIKVSRSESIILRAYRFLQYSVNKDLKVYTTPWGETIHASEIMQFLPSKLIEGRLKFAQRLHELGLSVQEDAILKALVLTFTDRCELTDRAKVENIQEKLLICLQHLLNIRPGGPKSLFCKIITVLTDLRVLSHEESNHAGKLFIRWPMIDKEHYNLIGEILS